VWQAGGAWFLEATGAEAAVGLVDAVLSRGLARPVKITTSGTVGMWLRAPLADRGTTITRHHDLLVMVCRATPGPGEGRWASPADRPALERYQAAYNEERLTTTAPDWDRLTSRPSVAVLERDGRIVAFVKRTADAARYATIGGTWTDPAFRHQGLARRLTSFLINALLAEAPAVHLIVDDDNAPAIALYRSLNFEETGSCWMAYLETR
jgi:ribosomal protein S18 acetylase RimI-like enzyme